MYDSIHMYIEVRIYPNMSKIEKEDHKEEWERKTVNRLILLSSSNYNNNP